MDDREEVQKLFSNLKASPPEIENLLAECTNHCLRSCHAARAQQESKSRYITGCRSQVAQTAVLLEAGAAIEAAAGKLPDVKEW